MAAVQSTDVVAVMLEKVRKKLPVLYERSDALFAKIQKRDVEKTSTRTARIPLQVKPGGRFGYAALDGGDLGRGSGTALDVAQITPVGLKFAVEINKLVEYATNSSEKATANYTRTEVANAMKQFRRDLDTQLQTAGNGVMGTISVVAGNLFTLSDTPFGARLAREQQVCQVYSANLATNRGAVTLLQVSKSLGSAQTVTVDAVPGGTIAGDVLVPEGLAGASPVGLYGLPYHHSSGTTGTWMGIARANNYVVAEMVNANSAGLALPHLRLAVDKPMQILDIEEVEAFKSLAWYGHRAQRAAYHEIAFSISQLVKGGSGQDFDLLFRGESIGGIKTMWNIHADPSRLDLINFETWGRVEWKEIDYYEVGGNTVFPVYGPSGGLAAAYLFYFVTGVQYFVDNPKALGGITSLAVPTGYLST